jgi:spermidine synthase
MAKKRRHKAPRRQVIASAPRAGGGRALEVDGVVQSVSVDAEPAHGRAGVAGTADETSLASTTDVAPGALGYWELMLPDSCPRRALVLGLGGGTVAALLARRCHGVSLVGVERDETVLALARTEFGLDAIPSLAVVVTDAFAEVAERAEREPGSYDYICLDLYEGDRLAPGSLATAFLRQLATLLDPRGTLAVNLLITGRLGEQMRRLRRVFEIERERRTRGNIVVHARASLASEAPSVP